MARRRRRSAIRRTGRRRRGVSSRGIRRLVKSVMWRNAETKFYLTNTSNVSIKQPYTGELSWFDGLTQGLTATTRIGNQIHVKNIAFKLVFNFTAGSDVRAWMRILILYPRKSVDTATLATYLTASNPGLYGRADPTLFVSLFDRFYELNAASNAGAGGRPSTVKVKYFKKVRYIMNYNGGNTVDREPTVYIVSSIPVINTEDIRMNGYFSMAFKDF